MDNLTVYCSIIEDMRKPIIALSGKNNSLDAINYASVCLHVIASFFGVLENALIIYIIGFQMTKSVITVWIMNLAISDLMTALSLPIFTYFLASGQTWTMGTILCRVYSAVFFLNMFVSSFLLCIISIDRCFLIAFPVWSQNHRDEMQASLICAVVWMCAILNTLPYYVFRDTIPCHDGRIMCYYNFMLYSSTTSNSSEICKTRQYAFAISKFVIAFLIPLVIITACYITVIRKLQSRRRKTPGRFFKLTTAVIIAFILCWLPYHVFSILEAYADYKKSLRPLIRRALPFITSLAFINSLINPCLYVFVCPDFTAKIQQSLRAVLEHVLVEDTEVSTICSKTRLSTSSGLPLQGYKFVKCKGRCLRDTAAIT
ncbi:prostaglandin D2 receptor 2-like [Protopterus annectens]|uniref:prostaglandin D2 receptor 2-like n=1 Tax=Protopterus annectens TaxID=7888 RepID=UPI001CF99E83|nr:prostaglandin D2 receptor 2-like [Protopterus annectens]XP_043939978.1 prostaglandin D2 receptor 2-like [Protopterus annectens]